MKQNISISVKLILFVTLICIFIVQAFLGCDERYSKPKNSRLRTQSEFTNYIGENFDKYKSRIKEESGYEGKVVSEKKDGKEQRYIEFDIDNNTKIKFEVNGIEIIISKQITQLNEDAYGKKLEICLIGIDVDATVYISVETQFGYISCEYKANDLEHPLPSRKEKEEGIDVQIKRDASTEELKELTSKAHSIYAVFEEICNEYNESIENESK